MNLTLTNLHPFLRPPTSKWRRRVQRLVRVAWGESPRFKRGPPSTLGIAWVDDGRMAELNREHLRHRGPTDILTFEYGAGVAEIVISLDTARREAECHQQSFGAELTLYLAHGILHLAGLNDKTPHQCRRMRREEQWLIQQLKIRD